MNLNLSFQQGLNTSQQLSLAPQLLQWLRLLHVPTLDLSELIQQELDSNPALELDESNSNEMESDFEKTNENNEDIYDTTSPDKDAQIDDKYEFLKEVATDWNDESSCADSSTTYTSHNEALEKYEYAFNSIASSDSLYEHLTKQIALANSSHADPELVELLIGSLDERGYLETTLEALSTFSGASIEKLEKALSTLQSMNPVGIGARDLRECLLLQMPNDEKHRVPRLIVINYLEAMARKQYAEVADILNVTEDEIMKALSIIKALVTTPGITFSKQNATRYVTADAIIHKSKNDYRIEINDSCIPRIRISAACKSLLEKKNLSQQELSYIRDKIRSANFIVQGIQQRKETLRKVTEEIIKEQRDFFDTEEGKTKPLTMAKLADKIGVHETTVSRATANKYIQTPRGLFPMKHFFSSGYNCANGSSLTPESVKELITELVKNEKTNNPLTDIQISNVLKTKGLRIARRTIAKYREETGIPSSKERAQFAGISVRSPKKDLIAG